MIFEYINVLNWKVKVLIITSHYDINYILAQLESIGCKSECTYEAVDTIISGKKNIGFTYSNHIRKQSIVLIGLQESKYLLINTIAHESRHLLQHIANSNNLDLNSEDVCYLLGDIVLKIYTICVDNNLF